MGVLQLFATLLQNLLTKSAIRVDFKENVDVDCFLVDFNSIVHTSSQAVIGEINSLMGKVLHAIEEHRAVDQETRKKLEQFKFPDVFSKKGKNEPVPKIGSVLKEFHNHFKADFMDNQVILRVIKTLKSIINTYTRKNIKVIYLAIDGVPSKGKMVEQKQRRYLGAIMESYKNRIMETYLKYLREQSVATYLLARFPIKWSRNKITPGTAFMHKLVAHLRSAPIQKILKSPKTEMVISDMYEVGEGEKKIVNYVEKYFDSNAKVMVYSPDADMILLCILLPMDQVYMLRHDQEAYRKEKRISYDLIDIKAMKENISFYVKTEFSKNSNENSKNINLDTRKINFDIVCTSTLFGNDFVPKIETLDVKKGFQSLIDAYVKTLAFFKGKKYLVQIDNANEKTLDLEFLVKLIENVIPEEDDFIKYNKLYGEYIHIGRIKNAFPNKIITDRSLFPIVKQFKQQYFEFQQRLKRELDDQTIELFARNKEFLDSLKRSVNIVISGNPIATTHLTNEEFIKVLVKFYKEHGNFPRVAFNLDKWSHSANDPIHKHRLEGSNNYEREVYQFDHMLDEYYVKFNAQPLDLQENKIDAYYETYFGAKPLAESSNNDLNPDIVPVMHDYLQAVLWVFNYYFNDKTYMNTWFYPHERTPLMGHFFMYLKKIDNKEFEKINSSLTQFQVSNIKTYFNPLEQLMYVSPMTPDIIKLLPQVYRTYIESDNLDPFLQTYFISISELTGRLWDEQISGEVDCKGIPYFNKCLLKAVEKPSSADDKLFLKAIKKVKPDAISKIRSQNAEPPY
jgi:5'-3' exonuclease